MVRDRSSCHGTKPLMGTVPFENTSFSTSPCHMVCSKTSGSRQRLIISLTCLARSTELLIRRRMVCRQFYSLYMFFFLPLPNIFIKYFTFQGITRYDTTNEDQEIALVGGLHPAVTYKFRVFSINFIDLSEPTKPVVAKTQEEG